MISFNIIFPCKPSYFDPFLLLCACNNVDIAALYCLIFFFSLPLPFSEVKVAHFSSDIFRTAFLVIRDNVSHEQKVKSRPHNLYLSHYLTNLIHKICFTISFISCLYMFLAHVLIIWRSKLHYTARGIITPIAVMRCDDTRGCIMQF